MVYQQKTKKQAGAQASSQAETSEAASAVQASGPLARTVERARVKAAGGRGKAADWGAVAQAVAQQYHALGAQVTQQDLLAALRRIPDQAARDGLMSQLAGGDAEGLKSAVEQGAAKASAWKRPRTRLNLPQAGHTQTTAQANDKGAAKKPVPKPVPRAAKVTPAKPQAKAQVVANKPKSAPQPAQAGRQTKSRQVQPPSKPLATQPQLAKGHPKTVGKAQAAGKNKDLKVASAALFAGLNIPVQSTWKKGGKLVFAGPAWKRAQQQVQKAVLARQAAQQKQQAKQEQASRKPQGQGTGAQAEAGRSPHTAQAQMVQPQTAQPRPAKPRKAIRVPAATISAAEIKRHEQQNRQKNQRQLATVLARARKARAGLASVKAKAAPLITSAQHSAQTQVAAALTQSLSQMASAQQTARATVISRASQATATVNAAYASTTQGIRQDTTRKIAELKTQATTLKTKLVADKDKLSSSVKNEFTRTQQAMRSIGQEVSGRAKQIGEAQASRYESEPIPEQNAVQKLANGADYYKNKHRAKVEAARATAADYASGMNQAGNDQAGQVMTSLPSALEAHGKLLQEYQRQLDQYVTGQISGLQQQQSQALQAASTQRSALLAQISQQRASALAGIASAASRGRAQAQAQAQKARSSVARQAQAAKAGVNRGVLQAGQQMDGRIRQFAGQARAHLNQDHADFSKSIAGFERYAAQGATAAQSGILSSARTAAGRVRAGGAPAASGLRSLGSSTASSIRTQGTGAASALTALGKSGQTGLRGLLSSHTRATQAALSASKTQLNQFSSGFGRDAAKVLEDTKTQLEGTKQPFRDALNKVLDAGDGQTPAEITAIQQAAESAAAAVQPRWKAWASVLIDVVVVIATIAAIAALTTVLGPVGLILAGMAIGALGQVAGQAMKDAVNGKMSDWKTYAAAGVTGAIGGAFGGAGGIVGGALSKGMVTALGRQGVGRVGQVVTKVGLESAVGTGADLASQVAAGYTNKATFGIPYDIKATFSATNIARTALTNTAGTALAHPGTLKFVGTKLNSINIPGKGLLGKFGNTLSNTGFVRGINKIDAKIVQSAPWKKTIGGLEAIGNKAGSHAGNVYKQGQSAYHRAGDRVERIPAVYKVREQFRKVTDPSSFKDAVTKTQADIDHAIQKIPDPEVRRAVQEHVDWIEKNPHLFTSGHDKGVFYSGAKSGLSNAELVGKYHSDDPLGSTRIDDTPGGKHLEGLELYKKYATNTEWADIVWKKASQTYARNVRGNIHEFVDGANPQRVYHQTEKPIIDAHPRVTGRTWHDNPGQPGSQPASPVTPAPLPGSGPTLPPSFGHGPFFDPKAAEGLQAMSEGKNPVDLPGSAAGAGQTRGETGDAPSAKVTGTGPEAHSPAKANEPEAGEQKTREAQEVDESDPDHLTQDDQRTTKEEVERSQPPQTSEKAPGERLRSLGVSDEDLKGLGSSDLEALAAASESWNTTAEGRSQGVIHVQDYAEGKGGSGKQNRLQKLSEYTGRGSFDASDPLAMQKVTQLLDELTTSPTLPPREVGEKKIYFIAKDNAQPPYAASQKGIIIIKFQDKYSTFMNGNYKSFGRME